ncbi:MAG: hypothetical protein QM811_18405 [Pirellulales bacterium]
MVMTLDHARRSSRKPVAADRVPAVSEDMLPWADPYILSLMQRHESELRATEKSTAS